RQSLLLIQLLPWLQPQLLPQLPVLLLPQQRVWLPLPAAPSVWRSLRLLPWPRFLAVLFPEPLPALLPRPGVLFPRLLLLLRLQPSPWLRQAPLLRRPWPWLRQCVSLRQLLLWLQLRPSRALRPLSLRRLWPSLLQPFWLPLLVSLSARPRPQPF